MAGPTVRRDESTLPTAGTYVGPGAGMWGSEVSAPDLHASVAPLCPPVIEVVGGQHSPMDGKSQPYFRTLPGDVTMSAAELSSAIDDMHDMPRALIASSSGKKVVFSSVLDLQEANNRYPPLRHVMEVPVFGAERLARARAKPAGAEPLYLEDLEESSSSSVYDLKAGQLGSAVCRNVNAISTPFRRSSSCNLLLSGVQISEMVRVGHWIFASASV